MSNAVSFRIVMSTGEKTQSVVSNYKLLHRGKETVIISGLFCSEVKEVERYSHNIK